MIYGVKVIHTLTVIESDQRYYEELILKVEADSFDDAYEKAEQYMKNYVCEYENLKGETVKTLNVETVDCFLAHESDGHVQEVYSSFSVNHSSLTEEEYYKTITFTCSEKEMRSLRNSQLF